MPDLLRCRLLLVDTATAPIADAGVLVEAGVVLEVGPWDRLERHADSVGVVELHGVTMPGLVDAHNHLRGTPLELQGVSDAPLEEWLLQLRTLTDLSWADEAQLAVGQLLGTGVTTVQGVLHGLAAPAAYADQVQGVLEVLTRSGIRADVFVGLTDQAEYAPPGLLDDDLAGHVRAASGTSPEDLAALVDSLRDGWEEPAGRVRVGVAPVAPQWSSGRLLAVAAELAGRGARVHTHLLESPAQRHWLPEGPVERLGRTGLLGPQLSVAHGVWLEDEELAGLADAGVGVVHCPTSNRALQAGAARVGAWWAAGLVPALATDSHPTEGRLDMFAQMRGALMTAEQVGLPLTPVQVLTMATSGGAAALGLGGSAGVVEPGRVADLVTVDLPVPAEATGAETTAATTAEAMVGATPDLVAHVLIGGRRVVREGRLEAADQVREARARVVAQIEADARERRRRQDEMAPRNAQVLRGLRDAGLVIGVGARS